MLVFQGKQYKKSLRKLAKSGTINMRQINHVVNMLRDQVLLPIQYRDHPLTGPYEGFRECHIKPDLLLIYKIEKDVLVLLLADIGSHSSLFGK